MNSADAMIPQHRDRYADLVGQPVGDQRDEGFLVDLIVEGAKKLDEEQRQEPPGAQEGELVRGWLTHAALPGGLNASGACPIIPVRGASENSECDAGAGWRSNRHESSPVVEAA